VHDGSLTIAHYARLLVEIYHYVKHSTRLLALAASRLGSDQPRLFKRFLEHAEEESGHDLWALNDLRALGADQESVIASSPLPSTVALYANQYYVIEHIHPIGLLGYIYALETLGSGSGAAMGTRIKTLLGVGDEAVTFLVGHGESDVVHVQKLRALVEEHAQLAAEQVVIRDSAVASYTYYTQMLADVWSHCEVRLATS
jgi:pyrroloquinoline quinone (PQQ) biosynthesis protein C